jgi:hypothetical protein
MDVEESQLTRQQKQLLDGVRRICFSFFDKEKVKNEKDFNPVPRTWGQIRSISGVSTRLLSNRLRELIRQGVVKVEKGFDEKGRLLTFYTYTKRPFDLKITETVVQKITMRDIEGHPIKDEKGHDRMVYVLEADDGKSASIPAARVYFDENGVKEVRWGHSKLGKKRDVKEDEVETRHMVKGGRIETVKPEPKVRLRKRRYFVEDKRSRAT